MRKFKFRVYEIPTDCMRYSVEMCPSFHIRVRDEKQIIMQYIGLKDKNGKEIYEGDICADYDEACVGKIEYCEYDAKFYYFIQMEDGEFDGYSLYDYPDIEVIGNIYQNPELLEV